MVAPPASHPSQQNGAIVAPAARRMPPPSEPLPLVSPITASSPASEPRPRGTVEVPSAPPGGATGEQGGHHGTSLNEVFRRFAHRVSYVVGTPGAFLTALAVLVAWAASGPFFGFSDTWQLIINTGTTIVTFLMVFLIQSTQNRDASAIHLKLDELIRATRSARNSLVMLEQMSDDELKVLERQFEELRTKSRNRRPQE